MHPELEVSSSIQKKEGLVPQSVNTFPVIQKFWYNNRDMKYG